VPLPQQDDVSRLRHAIRGCLNALKLGVSALDTGMSGDEAVEFLGYLEQSADKMVVLLDQWESLPEHAET
jgi:signal transduction histidine kinase